MNGNMLAGLGLVAAIVVCLLAQRTFILILLLGLLVAFMAYIMYIARAAASSKETSRSETITRETVKALFRPR